MCIYFILIHHLYQYKHAENGLQLFDDTYCTHYTTCTFTYNLQVHISQPCATRWPSFVNPPNSSILKIF